MKLIAYLDYTWKDESIDVCFVDFCKNARRRRRLVDRRRRPELSSGVWLLFRVLSMWSPRIRLHVYLIGSVSFDLGHVYVEC